ncbi:Protein pat-12, partial [Caenorhabditis elegans]
VELLDRGLLAEISGQYEWSKS